MSIYTDIIETEKLLDQCYDLETGEINEAEEKELNEIKERLIAEGAENLCKLRANLNAEFDGLYAEKKRLDDALKRKGKQIERLEQSIIWIYQHQTEEKLKAGTFTISTRKSTKCVLDDDFADDRYIIKKEVSQPDLAAIKEALKAGEVINGASLVINQNLTVK